jgi:hypothetical protein
VRPRRFRRIRSRRRPKCGGGTIIITGTAGIIIIGIIIIGIAITAGIVVGITAGIAAGIITTAIGERGSAGLFSQDEMTPRARIAGLFHIRMVEPRC